VTAVYVDGLVKAAVTVPDGPPWFTRQPADLLKRIPCGVLDQIPGSGRIDPRFSGTQALFQLDAYAAEKRAAFDLCSAAVDALVAAWRTQHVFDDGWISSVEVTSDVAEVRERDQPSTFTRYQATVRLTCRS
jgi:hypothetical protein